MSKREEWLSLGTKQKQAIRKRLLKEGKYFCSKCYRGKRVEFFFKSKITKFGLGSWCRSCASKRWQQRFQTDPAFRQRVRVSSRKAGRKQYQKKISTEEGHQAEKKRVRAYYWKHRAEILRKCKERYRKKKQEAKILNSEEHEELRDLTGL